MTEKQAKSFTSLEKARNYGLAAIVFLIIVVLVYQIKPLYAYDFRTYFYPASRLFIVGQNPYAVDGFYNPPWLLIAMIPFALLPEQWAQAVFLSTAMCTFLLVCAKLRLGRLSTLAFLLSFPTIYSLLYGNLEWLVLLGLLLPPQIGVFLVLIKPHVGLGIFLYWVIQAWRKERTSGVFKLLWPLLTVALISMLIYGPWPLRFALAAESSTTRGLNASAWPWLLPLGFYIAFEMVEQPDLKKSLLIGPALSPHLVEGSWCGLFIAFSDRPVAMVLANLAVWGAVIQKMLG